MNGRALTINNYAAKVLNKIRVSQSGNVSSKFYLKVEYSRTVYRMTVVAKKVTF